MSFHSSSASVRLTLSSQHHDLRKRFYVLEDKESNIVIEASQPVTDTLPFDYEPVVDSFRFASD